MFTLLLSLISALFLSKFNVYPTVDLTLGIYGEIFDISTPIFDFTMICGEALWWNPGMKNPEKSRKLPGIENTSV